MPKLQDRICVELAQRHERPAAKDIGEHHRAADGHRFQGRSRLREHQVHAGQQILGAFDHPAPPKTGHLQLDPALLAGLSNHLDVPARLGLVAEHERPLRSRRQRTAWREALKIHEVEQPLDPLGRDALLRRQPIDARRVHGDVSRNRRMMEGRFFPGQESVAEVHDRHARKVKRGDQCFEVMVSVDEIGCEADLVQIADDGHCGGAQFFGNLTEGQAERHRADGPGR